MRELGMCGTSFGVWDVTCAEWELSACCPTELYSVSQTEAEWIDRLDPLVNAMVPADEADKRRVREAFKRYFQSFFSKRVRGDG